MPSNQTHTPTWGNAAPGHHNVACKIPALQRNFALMSITCKIFFTHPLSHSGDAFCVENYQILRLWKVVICDARGSRIYSLSISRCLHRTKARIFIPVACEPSFDNARGSNTNTCGTPNARWFSCPMSFTYASSFSQAPSTKVTKDCTYHTKWESQIQRLKCYLHWPTIRAWSEYGPSMNWPYRNQFAEVIFRFWETYWKIWYFAHRQTDISRNIAPATMEVLTLFCMYSRSEKQLVEICFQEMKGKHSIFMLN